MIKKTNSSEANGLMNTIIGKDTIVTGTVDVKGALRVDGQVKGKVLCSDCVTVGATGEIEADIEAQTAVIAGHVTGNIVCSDKVELQAKCEMDGDLKTKSLVIEQGAVFHGNCNMKNPIPPGQPAQKPEIHRPAQLQPKAEVQTSEKTR